MGNNHDVCYPTIIPLTKYMWETFMTDAILLLSHWLDIGGKQPWRMLSIIHWIDVDGEQLWHMLSYLMTVWSNLDICCPTYLMKVGSNLDICCPTIIPLTTYRCDTIMTYAIPLTKYRYDTTMTYAILLWSHWLNIGGKQPWDMLSYYYPTD